MKPLDSVINFLRTQYPGILVTLVLGIILWGWKKALYFMKTIPQAVYKRRMERTVSKSMNKTNETIGLDLLPKVRLKIVTIEAPPQEMEDKLIIFVKKENRPLVYSNIIFQALDKSFLKDSKKYIHPDLYSSAKYMTGKITITSDKTVEQLDDFEKNAIKYFDRKMEDVFLKGPILALLQKEELLTLKGFFKEVLLQELYAVGERTVGRLPSDECKRESLSLVDFLYNQANKKEYQRVKGILPPLEYIAQYFRVGIIFVKRADTVDLTNHFRAVRILIEENGAKSIYIFGIGRHIKRIKGDFVDWLNQVAKKDYNNEWSIHKIFEHKLIESSEGEEKVAVCCLYKHKSWL